MKDDSATVLSQQTIIASNPADRGSFAVKKTFYGSGTDIKRPEFGKDVAIKTKTVDVSPYASITGAQAKDRKKFWGFDLKKALTSVAVSPDGKVVVTGSSDTMEHIWDLETGERLRTLGGQVKPASPLVISPDGTWLVAPTESGSTLGAALWNVETGKRIGSLKGHQGPVHDVTVSWDGRYVATAGEDGTARVWDARTGDQLQFLGAHRRPVRAVAFSPRGYRLATGSTDQTIRLWDATTGAHIMCLTQRASGIYDLAYAPVAEPSRPATATAPSASGKPDPLE
jgi:WD40 repeat protein